LAGEHRPPGHHRHRQAEAGVAGRGLVGLVDQFRAHQRRVRAEGEVVGPPVYPKARARAAAFSTGPRRGRSSASESAANLEEPAPQPGTQLGSPARGPLHEVSRLK
jgi:hypothetical protein